MIRGANKTFKGFTDMHKELISAAESAQCLASAYRNIIPPGWDSPAFCSNLYNASCMTSLRHASQCSNILSGAIQQWKTGGAKSSLQKLVYTSIQRSISNDTALWVDFIQDKLSVLAPSPEFQVTPQTVAQLFTEVRSIPSHSQTCFLKSVINSWATSYRYGENPLLPCIYGCNDEMDNLKHYLVCDPLWTLAVSACGLPSSLLSLSAVERLCMHNRSPVSFKLLSVVYRAYHALRLGHRTLVEQGIANNVFQDIHTKYLLLCTELWVHHGD